ncbi:type II secretion system protein GspH [Sphingorhabdus sp. IMCC26285]|uniref:Type II secretion system protein H n=1 Tax=Sphingorhabdus profundilacus TaxID=2509718 RepID=A0A6I4M126_9SPHN|nr:GspH/FimT family pseudopilin [Sphingorhabdus profundilacus]MVZ96118.1 type II secretion system protein GspH [Sphingorhabdus profundilacus]
MKMRIFTANKLPHFQIIRETERGFTLVELMVVIFIIGLASAAVVMTSRASGGGARDEAEQLAARIAALRDNAILQSRTMAVWVRPSGYGFETRSAGVWAPIATAPFTMVDWQRGTTVRLHGDRQLRVAFDSTGLPSSAVGIDVVRGDAVVTVNLAATGDVRVAR